MFATGLGEGLGAFAFGTAGLGAFALGAAGVLYGVGLLALAAAARSLIALFAAFRAA